MLEKPPIDDAGLIACLHETYGLYATELEFMPLGYDTYASVYRVTANDGQVYFLKLKHSGFDPASADVPHALRGQGLTEVVAPLPTLSGDLWTPFDTYTLLIYPYIDGNQGMDVGLSDAQWITFGTALKKLHTATLPDAVASLVPRESFVPMAYTAQLMRQLQNEIPTRQFHNPIEQEAAAFWMSCHDEAELITERAHILGRRMQQQSPEFVLCHADIHTANLLLTPDGDLHIVDWDQPIFAPRERDLMFVIGSSFGNLHMSRREEDLFFQGYGKTEVDPVALGYYRYSRALEDIADFAARIFLFEDSSDAVKQDSLKWLRIQFAHGDTVYNARMLDPILFPDSSGQ